MNNTNNAMDFELLTQKEAAKILRMSEAWLERQRWERKGIPFIKVGGRVFYDKQDLFGWLKQQKSKFKS